MQPCGQLRLTLVFCTLARRKVAETLPEDILKKMHAPPKADDPVMGYTELDRLLGFDGVMFGIPTRFGLMPAQMKAFFDSTGDEAEQNMGERVEGWREMEGNSTSFVD